MRLIDRYLLRQTAGPLAGALVVTLTALLLERALRLLQQLAGSNDRYGYLAGLLVSLVPHYVGLILPAAFFLAMFVVFSRLSDGAEVDVMMAGGLSLDRVAAPFLALGGVLAVVSLVSSGFLQPEGRYAYRALLNAAANGGWNGRLEEQVFVSPDTRTTLTADRVDASGRELKRVFIREEMSDGRERLTTAPRARLRPEGGSTDKVVLALADGQEVTRDKRQAPQVLVFKDLDVELAVSSARKLVRKRGEDQRELTLAELAHDAATPHPAIPRQSLLAELYGHLARALALPLLPLLALPLSLSAKRGGRTAGLIAAGLMLFAFQHLLQVGQSLAESGKVKAMVGVGAPFAVFAGLAAWMFLGSRIRPGETPIARSLAWIGAGFERARTALARLRPRVRAAA